MADVAQLGIRVQSTGVQQARDQLAQMQRAAAGAEEAARDLERQAMTAGASIARAFAAGAVTGALAATLAGLKSIKGELLEIDRVSRLTNLSLNQVNALGVLGRMNGLTDAQVNSGLTGLAGKLNEARREENELTKLLDANNAKWKDREGNVLSVNAALDVAANLMAAAATNLDRIDIAKKLGLTAEWVPLLENGARAFQQQHDEARALAGTIDTGMVQAAKEFDSAWNRGWEAFSQAGKGAVLDIGRELAGLAARAGTFIQGLNRRFQDAFRREYSEGEIRQLEGMGVTVAPVAPSARPPGMSDATWRTLQSWLRDGRDTSRDFSPWERLREPGGGGFRSTRIPGSDSGGGGGSEPDSSYDRALRQLEERNALARKELETMGLSTAQRESSLALERAINIAKRDGTPLTEEQLQKLRAQSEEYGRIQAQLEQTKKLMRELRELSDFARSTVSGLFTDTLSGIQQGNGVWESFAQAAVNALNKISNKLAEMAINGLWEAAFPTAGGGGGLFGALLSGVFGSFGGGGDKFAVKAAQGEVFRDGNVIPFAKGGIIDRPTVFGMSGGRTGLAGEAGTEGIFPIRRMSNGDLGVAAANSNQPQPISLTVVVEGANGDQHVMDLVRQGVEAGMSQVQANIVPTVREGLRRGALR